MTANSSAAAKDARWVCANGCGTVRLEDRYGEGLPCSGCGHREWRSVSVAITDDAEAMGAIRVLKARGFTAEQVGKAMEGVEL